MNLLNKYIWLLSIITILLLWSFLSLVIRVDSTLLASPLEVMREICMWFFENTATEEKVYIHAFYTAKRAVHGWIITLIFGGFIGILLGNLPALYRALEPVIEFVRSIPPLLAFPLFLVAFNYAEIAYIWTIVFGCLPIMILTVCKGVQEIVPEKIEMMRLYKVKTLTKFFVFFMEILPSIFLGARLSLSFALVIAVVSEMVFTPRSGWALGALARDAEISFDTPKFYACVLIIGLFGYFTNMFLRVVGDKFFKNKL